MKRKLWIVLALVALLSIALCTTVGADYVPAQFLEPVTLNVAVSDGYQTVTITAHWNLNFVPTKVELFQTRAIDGPVYVRTLEGDLSRNGSASTSWNYHDWFYNIKDYNYIIRAYDSNDNYALSQVFPMISSQLMDFLIEQNGYFVQYVQIAYNGSNWPSDPVREGKFFEGWYNDENYLHKNYKEYSRAVYARFVNPCTVVFYLNGHGAQAPQQQVLPLDTPGTHVQEPTPPTAEGYTFDGWYTMPTCENQFAYNFNSELTASVINLYAKWRSNVTFDANGGEVSVNEAVTDDEGKLSSLPVPIRDGYVFTGWYTTAYAGTKVDLNRIYTTATTIYAHWIKMPVFVTQPVDGTVYPWSDYKIRWTTDQVPKRIDIGFKNGSSWISKETITTGLKTSMSYDLTYNDAVAKDTWTVRAYYGEGNFFIPSQTFSITKSEYYSCGRKLTATLSNGVLTISGTGAMYDYNINNLPPWYGIRSSITEVVIGDGVTSIGEYGLYYCTKLHTVTIPVSVTSVGKNAFYCCNALRYGNYNGFKSQWNEVSVGIGNTLLTEHLYYLYLSGTLSGGARWQLYGISGKLEIYGGNIPAGPSLPWYDYAPYIREIWVEYGVKTIGADAFRNCSGVTEVHIDDRVTQVGTRAFQDCAALTDVYYDSALAAWNVISIASGNTPLTGATIHTEPYSGSLEQQITWYLYDSGLLVLTYDGMDYEEPVIEDFDEEPAPWNQYAGTIQITSVCVESGIYRIGNSAFANLDQLKTIEIGNTVTSIGNNAFWGCKRLRDFVLPDSVTTIGDYAFRYCWSLEFLTIPESVAHLGKGAFRDCTNLEKVYLPDNLSDIGEECFMNCGIIDRINIPTAAAAIGLNTFASCDTLLYDTSDVYYNGTSAQWADIDFDDGNNDLLNCPNIHMTPEELRIDAAHFPDANFRAVIASDAFDTDESGWLTDEEIYAVTNFGTEDTDYTTVQGIEYFTEMTFLMLDGAPSLTSIDLSANTKLTHVEVFDNALTELNLSGLAELQKLSCDGNSLTSLDVSAFDMRELFCYNNPMTSLNLGSQSDLQQLFCFGTNLDTLDLRSCPLLLDCVYNGTKTVTANYVEYKVDNSHALRVSSATELILPGMIQIDAAHFPDEAFRNLIADNFDTNGTGWLTSAEIAAVTGISFEDHDFTTVQGIEYFTELQTICIADADSLNSIDLRANTKLTDIDLSHNGLTEINLDGLTEVKNLYIYHNCLQALDVSMLTALERLECDNNPLTSLILGGLPHLSQLYCYGTNLTSLDISGTPCLITAWLGTKDSSHAEHDWFTADECALEVDKGLSIITGLPAPAFTLPAALTTIEAEAFSGIAAEAVLIPAGVTSITGDPFSGSSVRYIYGSTDLVRYFAEANGYIFVPVRD